MNKENKDKLIECTKNADLLIVKLSDVFKEEMTDDLGEIINCVSAGENIMPSKELKKLAKTIQAAIELLSLLEEFCAEKNRNHPLTGPNVKCHCDECW